MADKPNLRCKLNKKPDSIEVKIEVDRTELDAALKLINEMTKKTDELLSNLSEIATALQNAQIIELLKKKK
ncbi:MAG: hypothetical protein ACI4II_00045 [Acutalibacteraceae bacterium]